MELFLHVYFLGRIVYGRNIQNVAPQYLETLCFSKGLETYRRMGTRRRNRKIAFPRDILHSAGCMVGEIVETKDYNTNEHKMKTAHQNTYFLERYGRNDFEPLGTADEVRRSLGYLMKYIEKSGERLIYGGDLPTYFVSDVADEDVICPYGIDDRKAVLADDFTCMVDGEIIGKVSKEVIAKMPKAN